jgi:hypothetical protein
VSGWGGPPPPERDAPAPTPERLREIAWFIEQLEAVVVQAEDLALPEGLAARIESNDDADQLHEWAELLAAGTVTWSGKDKA